jgi:hypothetical protein
MEETLTFYVVRNKDGKYHRKQTGIYADGWVSELKRAKVYTKKAPASSCVTFWAKNFSKYGIPELVPLNAILGQPIDQTERVTLAIKRKAIEEAKDHLYRVQMIYDHAVREKERYHNTRYDRFGVELALEKVTVAENKLKQLLNN